MRLRTKIILVLSVIFLVPCLGICGFAYVLIHRTPGEYFESNGARIYYTVQEKVNRDSGARHRLQRRLELAAAWCY